MAFDKMGEFSFRHSNQQDDLYKVMDAQQIKQAFDSPSEELKAAINKLVDQLQRSEKGKSGASNIGVTPIGAGPSDLQGTLEWLKLQIEQTVLGQLPDGVFVTSTSLKKHIDTVATTTQAGHVLLSNDATSDSETAAITPKAFKEGVDKKIEQTTFKKYKKGKDSNGVYTIVEYRRKFDNSLAVTSVLSGGTSPNYNLRTITYYGKDGETVDKTETFILSYDADGELFSEV